MSGELRFDDPAGLPEETAPAEAQALRALARELAAAHPEPALSPGFAARLWTRSARGWSWREAFRREPLLRLAAALLVFCALAVPVTAAVWLLFVRPSYYRPSFELEGPRPHPRVGDAAPRGVATVPPAPLDLEGLQAQEGWDWESLKDGLERNNRLQAAADSWQRRFAAAPASAPGPELLASLGDGARFGLELRLGLRAAPAGPRLEDWSAAAADELWAELQRRLAQGGAAPPVGLEERVHQLWAEGTPEQRAWLGEWITILDGPAAAGAWSLPAPGGPGLAVFWKAVEWLPPSASGASAARR